MKKLLLVTTKLLKEMCREWRVIFYLVGIAVLAFVVPAFAAAVATDVNGP